MRFIVPLIALILAGCGATSVDRAEYPSSCRMETSISVGNYQLGQETVVFKSVLFHQIPATNALKKGVASYELTLSSLGIGDNIAPELMAVSLTVDGTEQGIGSSYGKSLKDPFVDEEGFHHYTPEKRDISGRIRKENDLVTYQTRLAEKGLLPDKVTGLRDVDRTFVTALRVMVEKDRLIGVEINWPVAKDSRWRGGALGLPVLDMWEGRNEYLCAKSMSLTR